METLRTLEANDILFVDSTHVAKLNSDVKKLVLEVLPVLREGVLIHFHDIFWPFEYPPAWVREGRAWNEAYLLRAFLEFNDRFEILFFADYLHQYHSKGFQAHMPLYVRNTGGSLWMRKGRRRPKGKASALLERLAKAGRGMSRPGWPGVG